MASGFLPIALGDATKTIRYLENISKEYIFEVEWGVKTNTADIEGIVESIGWRLTVVRTFSKNVLYIPNTAFSSISICSLYDSNVSLDDNNCFSARLATPFATASISVLERISLSCLSKSLILGVNR